MADLLATRVLQARPIRTVGMSVRTDDGCNWMTMSGGSPRVCAWCGAEHTTGWVADRFRDGIVICPQHIVTNWAAEPVDPSWMLDGSVQDASVGAAAGARP